MASWSSASARSSPPPPPEAASSHASPISRVMRLSVRHLRRAGARRRATSPPPALRGLLIRYPEHDASTVAALLARHSGDVAAVDALLQRARAPPTAAPAPTPTPSPAAAPAPAPDPAPAPAPLLRAHVGVRRLAGSKRSRDYAHRVEPASHTPPHTPSQSQRQHHHQHHAPPPPTPRPRSPSTPLPRRPHTFGPASTTATISTPLTTNTPFTPIVAPLPPPVAPPLPPSHSDPTKPLEQTMLLDHITRMETRLYAFVTTSRQQHLAIRRALHHAQVELQSIRAAHNVLLAELEETNSRVSRADDFLDRLRRDVQTALLAKRNTTVSRVSGLALHLFYTVLSVTVRVVFFVATMGKRAWIAVSTSRAFNTSAAAAVPPPTSSPA